MARAGHLGLFGHHAPGFGVMRPLRVLAVGTGASCLIGVRPRPLLLRSGLRLRIAVFACRARHAALGGSPLSVPPSASLSSSIPGTSTCPYRHHPPRPWAHGPARGRRRRIARSLRAARRRLHRSRLRWRGTRGRARRRGPAGARRDPDYPAHPSCWRRRIPPAIGERERLAACVSFGGA